MTETEDALYALARGNTLQEFYLDRDEALTTKEELEEQYPPEELNLAVYHVSDLEEVERE